MKCQEEIDLLRALPHWRLLWRVGASADTWLPLYKQPGVGAEGWGGAVLKREESNLSDRTGTCLCKV